MWLIRIRLISWHCNMLNKPKEGEEDKEKTIRDRRLRMDEDMRFL